MKVFCRFFIYLLLGFYLNSSFLFSQPLISASELWNKPDANFFKKKRNELWHLLPQKSVAILFSEDPDFFYLTGCRLENSTLFIFKELQTFDNTSQNEFLFIPEPKTTQKMELEYTQPNEWIEKFSGVKTILPHSTFLKSDFESKKYDKILLNTQYANSPIAEEIKKRCAIEHSFNPILKRFLIRIQDANFDYFTKNIKNELIAALSYYPDLRNNELLLLSLQVKTPVEWEGLQKRITQYNTDTYSLSDFMAHLHQNKDENELFLIKRATTISNICLIDMIKSTSTDKWEHELACIASFYIQKYGAKTTYPVQVASGEYSTVAYYTQNHKKIRENEWIKMGVCTNYAGWNGLTVRTVPSNLKFSDLQKKIYQAVYKAHQAALEQCRPYQNFNAPYEAAMEVLKNEFFSLGIIKKSEDLRKYVREDVCQYIGISYPETGLYTTFKPNQVLVVSVSVSIPQKADCDTKWWNTGIKISDTIIISDNGHQNLSESVPKTVQEIEGWANQKPLLNIKLPSLD
ncbi:MAG: Xaa-Pro aminopeptidase [Bacteroidia bacterium]|nr:Xaa-Pro aminopeptidase [Bacteroidia bacterium]MDW8345914.1 aminopeptidase P N-terminal domain-containing protein [Bacteroidia bacterium]